MSTDSFHEDANLVSREESLEHAALAAAQGVVTGLAGLETWQKATLRKRPIPIFDLNGSVLFHDYPVVRGGQVVGTVRAAASRVLGAPVIAHIVGPNSWDYDIAVQQLTSRVRQEHPRWTIQATRLVCYSYPKQGVMFELLDEQGQPRRLIFDVADLTPIPEGRPEAGDMEGAYAWSFYESLSERSRRARILRFGAIDELRVRRASEARPDLRGEISIARIANLELAKWTVKYTRQLQFCTHYLASEARSHHSFVLHGQQKNDYCAVATCQMILCYYRYYYSQDEIAPALGYSSGGGCPTDQSAGYEALTCNHLDATFDSTPTFEEASKAIAALHPLKSGIGGHARACAGVAATISVPGGLSNEKLYIYDPWPWNADYKAGGSVYWEDWGSITHTNYVLTNLPHAC